MTPKATPSYYTSFHGPPHSVRNALKKVDDLG